MAGTGESWREGSPKRKSAKLGRSSWRVAPGEGGKGEIVRRIQPVVKYFNTSLKKNLKPSQERRCGKGSGVRAVLEPAASIDLVATAVAEEHGHLLGLVVGFVQRQVEECLGDRAGV